MEDSISIKSNESIATSDEYEFVAKTNSHSNQQLNIKLIEQPLLNIANNGDVNDLCMQLKEVLSDEDKMESVKVSNSEEIKISESPTDKEVNSPSSEKHDESKSDFGDDIDVFEDVQQECTNFDGICYLGSAAINAPKSESEIQRNMAILNEQSSEQVIMKVSVSVPSSSEGIVVLREASTQQVIARYEIHQILFYARGVADTPEASCFAFTWSHGDSQETAIFQCHVFRCDIPEAVSISQCDDSLT